MGPHGVGVFFRIDLRSTKLKLSAPRVELSEMGGGVMFRGGILVMKCFGFNIVKVVMGFL